MQTHVEGLIPIPRSEWRQYGAARTPQLTDKKWTYIVFTNEWFGWKPTDDESPARRRGCYPDEYFGIPLRDIREVEVICKNMGFHKEIRLHCKSDGNAEAVIHLDNPLGECRYYWLTPWLNHFRKVGIPIRGAEMVSLRTFRGWFNEFLNLYILFIVGFGAMLGCGLLLMHLVNKHGMGVFWAGAIVSKLLVIVFLIYMLMRRSNI